MQYQVLALKYRPKVFEDLVGQDTVTRTLTNAIQQDRIAHAFLFAGVRGVGKTTTARILAKALNCHRGPTVRPCGECPACREIAGGGALDVLEIDGASNNGVEQVREIVDGARYAPSRDRFKIYIIDEVHMLSTAAFNALLKTLEEPPPAVKFIFATTEIHKIPDTILSRCQEFEFRTVAPNAISDQLQKIATAENIQVSEAAIRAITRAAAGSLRDGISALDQVIAASGESIEETDVTELLGLIERDVLKRTTRALIDQDTAALLQIVDALSKGGRDYRYFTTALMQYLRDVLVAKVSSDPTELIELPGEADELHALSGELSEEDLLRALDVLTRTEDALRTSTEPRFHLEMALLKLSQLRRLASFEELLARFERLVGGGTPPSPSPAGPPSDSASDSGPKRVAKPAVRSAPKATAPRVERDARSVETAADWTADVPPIGEDTPPEMSPDAVERDFGTRLVEHLKTSKPMLHALVAHHETAQVERDRLTLRYASEQSVLAEQLKQKPLMDLLVDQASALHGARLTVAIEIGAEPVNGDTTPAPEREASTAPEGESLRERAGRDPLVRQFIDTFQGEIESVRKPDAPSS